VGYLLTHARDWPDGRLMLVNLSGRGDKDVELYAEASGTTLEA
jgi:tryptophan synthase beta subunit